MSTHQPSLPVREEPKTLDYYPEGDDGVPWSVNDWRALKEAFELTEAELVAWHGDLAGDTRHWKIIKRIFGVMAILGDAVEDEDAEEWNWAKLSKHWGVKEELLREELAMAVDHWKRLRVSRKIGGGGTTAGVKPVDGEGKAGGFKPHEEMAEERIGELLARYRFVDIVSHSERPFVARRLLELRPALEDHNRRESARQLIMMELNLADSEKVRALAKRRLDTLSKNADISDKQSAEIQAIQASLEKNEKAHTALSEKYFKAAAEFGEEEIEQGELRKVAIGTVSHFIEAQRQYHANHDRALIDGMFTADEIIWLTTAIPLRPAQYRPDLVLRVNEAMRPENLWAPDYVPSKIPREASRRLLKLVQGLTDEEDTPRIPEIDDAPGADDADDSEAPSAGDDPPPPPAEIPHTAPAFEPVAREEEFMVMG
jgi:hypothetical protein